MAIERTRPLRTVRTALFIAVLFLLLAAYLVCGPLAANYQTNLRYNLWKVGLVSYQPDVSPRFLVPDLAFRKSLQGKSLEEVRRFFPILVRPEEGNWDQRHYGEEFKGKDLRWIDQTNWAVLFENGRVVDIILRKG